MPRRKRPIRDESGSDPESDSDSGDYGFPIPHLRPSLYRYPADPAEFEKDIFYDTDEDPGDDAPERRRLALPLSEAVDYSTPDGQPLRYNPDILAKMMGNAPDGSGGSGGGGGGGGAIPAAIPPLPGGPGGPVYDAARQAAQQAGAFFFMGLPVEIRQRIMAPDLTFPGVIFLMSHTESTPAVGDTDTKGGGAHWGRTISPIISSFCSSCPCTASTPNRFKWLYVSQAMYPFEACQILYPTNIFEVEVSYRTELTCRGGLYLIEIFHADYSPTPPGPPPATQGPGFGAFYVPPVNWGSL